MRFWAVVAAAALAACAEKGTKAVRAEGEDLARYHRLGVLPFSDPKGGGVLIADEIKHRLDKLMYEPVDAEALQKTLSKYTINRDEGITAEALMDIHSHAPCDAIVFGRMSSDWSAGQVVMVDATMGETVMRAVLKPTKGKIFSDVDEVAKEAVSVLTATK